MKISKIKISKFHQFEDFELDLTYPKEHKKAGEPLDKVCFIGQSGTGKTTLLELIKIATVDGFDTKYVYPKFFEQGDKALFTFVSLGDLKDFTPNPRVELYYSGKTKIVDVHSSTLKPTAKSLLYFPAGIANNGIKNNAPEKIADIVEEPILEINRKKSLISHFIFDKPTLEKTWNAYYDKIKTYKLDSINARLKLFGEENGNEKFTEWLKTNPNPTAEVANECLDKLLNRFKLAVKTEIDDAGEKDILPIKSTIDNTVISYESLSTGTKQIIFTAFPIYQLLQDDSIVLMDEPETSLYPDIQREIIPYYTSFDKKKTSQFFFATHSPIIASAFEPWEIVELKFDEKGKVYRDKYYEGENHVDNYRLDPQILRYDQILTRIFDLSGDSDAKRAEKLQELSILKKQVEKLKKEEMENPTAETQKIINEYLQLSDDISGTWALSRHEKN